MKIEIINQKINLYHSGKNLLKNGYMTWLTENMDYYNYKNNHYIFKFLINLVVKLR